jgi:hypothetical protein
MTEQIIIKIRDENYNTYKTTFNKNDKIGNVREWLINENDEKISKNDVKLDYNGINFIDDNKTLSDYGIDRDYNTEPYHQHLIINARFLFNINKYDSVLKDIYENHKKIKNFISDLFKIINDSDIINSEALNKLMKFNGNYIRYNSKSIDIITSYCQELFRLFDLYEKIDNDLDINENIVYGITLLKMEELNNEIKYTYRKIFDEFITCIGEYQKSFDVKKITIFVNYEGNKQKFVFPLNSNLIQIKKIIIDSFDIKEKFCDIDLTFNSINIDDFDFGNFKSFESYNIGDEDNLVIKINKKKKIVKKISMVQKNMTSGINKKYENDKKITIFIQKQRNFKTYKMHVSHNILLGDLLCLIYDKFNMTCEFKDVKLYFKKIELENLKQNVFKFKISGEYLKEESVIQVEYPKPSDLAYLEDKNEHFAAKFNVFKQYYYKYFDGVDNIKNIKNYDFSIKKELSNEIFSNILNVIYKWILELKDKPNYKFIKNVYFEKNKKIILMRIVDLFTEGGIKYNEILNEREIYTRMKLRNDEIKLFRLIDELIEKL